MDLIEDNLIGMADAPESGQEGESRDKCECDFVVPLRGCRGRGLRGSLYDLIELDVRTSALLLLAGAANISLAQTPLRSGSRSHDG